MGDNSGSGLPKEKRDVVVVRGNDSYHELRVRRKHRIVSERSEMSYQYDGFESQLEKFESFGSERARAAEEKKVKDADYLRGLLERIRCLEHDLSYAEKVNLTQFHEIEALRNQLERRPERERQ